MSIISIIIVNYNAGNYLKECVRSVLSSNTEVEVFVSDNASTDDSVFSLREAVGADPRVTIIENEKNLGFSQGNNKAVPKTKGDYLAFLNPDCIINNNTLLAMKNILQKYPDAGMAGCLIRNADGTIQSTCIRSIPTPWNSLVRVLLLHRLFRRQNLFKGLDLANRDLPKSVTPVEGISGAFMFVRRDALQQVGLLDESYFLYCEDIDWMMRFHQSGWKILFVPDVEIYHAKGISSRQVPWKVLWYKHKGMIRFYRKFFRDKYPSVLFWLVYLGVISRFLLLSLLTAIQQLFPKNVKNVEKFNWISK